MNESFFFKSVNWEYPVGYMIVGGVDFDRRDNNAYIIIGRVSDIGPVYAPPMVDLQLDITRLYENTPDLRRAIVYPAIKNAFARRLDLAPVDLKMTVIVNDEVLEVQ